MEQDQRLIPAARSADLIIEEVPGETLIYDLKSHKAHCLNSTASLVWKHCDGKQTAEQVARRMEAELGAPVSIELVWLAVDRLEKLRLLEKPVERAPGAARISRREVVRRLGVTAAIALPLVTSIRAPMALQAVSGCGGAGAPCGNPGNPPCCMGLACGPPVPGTCHVT